MGCSEICDARLIWLFMLFLGLSNYYNDNIWSKYLYQALVKITCKRRVEWGKMPIWGKMPHSSQYFHNNLYLMVSSCSDIQCVFDKLTHSLDNYLIPCKNEFNFVQILVKTAACLMMVW